jgi:8-oxo-dGTP diphosphatase
MATPQFGEPEPGRDYPDRPAAFVVVERDGKIAVVDVAAKNRGLDLPGGGIDPDEAPAAAAVRECAEEAGLRVALEAEPFAYADQFNINQKGEAHNTRGRFFAGKVVAEDPALKVEDDHTLLWMAPQEALVRLHRDAHAWAVAAWLRRGRVR